MSAIPQFSLFDMTGAIIRFCFYTILTNNRVKFSWIRALVAHRESCWLIFLLRTTVGLTNPANTALCWKAMVTDGTGSGDSTICCVEPKSIRVIPTQVEKRTQRNQNGAETGLPRYRFSSRKSRLDCQREHG